MQFDKGVFFGYTIIMSSQEKVQKQSKGKKANSLLQEEENNKVASQAEGVFLDEKVVEEDIGNKTSSKKKKNRASTEENLQVENNIVGEKVETINVKPSENESISEEELKEKERIDEQKRKFDEAEQSVAKQNSKKKKLLNLGFLLLNIAIVAGILIYQLNGQKIELVHGLKLDGWAILLLFVFFGLTLLLDTFTISYLLRISTGKWKMGISFKVFAIGKYYDNITPLATGGQPFQITYLKNRGVPLHTALSVPMAKYLFQQIAWVLLGLICLIISSVDKSFNTFVTIASIIGFLLSFVMLAVVVFLCVCKTVGRKLVVKTLRLLYKMKIVKNYDKQYTKITKYIEDFQSVMQQYAKSPKDFFIMTITSIVRLIFYYSIPYFIYAMMKGFDSSLYVNFVVMSLLVDMASSFFPLPGGTGMNEISFSAMFASLFDHTLMTFWALLIWRFFSYYYNLIQGIVCITYDVAYGNRKFRWLQKKEMLMEESKVFKQVQIDKFRQERMKRRRTSRNKKKA